MTTDQEFAAIVSGLAHDDPSFVRRTRSATAHLGRPEVAVLVLTLAVLICGVLPLGLGLALHSTTLLAAAVAGLVVVPLAGASLLRPHHERTHP